MAIQRAIFVVLCSYSLLLAGCSSLVCEDTEKPRVTSNDGLVDLIHIQRDCGATTSISEHLFLVPSGQERSGVRPVLTLEKAINLKARWQSGKKLEVNFDSARIHRFTNHWNSTDIADWLYEVNITLVEG